MITLLSPAKTLDFDSSIPDMEYSEPQFVEEASQLISKLRGLSKKKLSKLMSLNKDLTEVNAMRYQEWEPTFEPEVARPAVLTFSGEVYRGLNASSFSQDDLTYSQDHLRILSGLHGLLRPLDRIRPYRLEMGTNLPVRRKKNLYQFWGEKITAEIHQVLTEVNGKAVINLASNEYAKAIDLNRLEARVITPVFKDAKNGEYKVIMTYAKHARGAMARYILKHQIEEPEEIKGFPDYTFSEKDSTDNEWVFLRG